MERLEQDKILAETARDIVRELIQKMGFQCEIEIAGEKQGQNDELSGQVETVLVFNVKTEESSFLIGQYGVNLQALQHLARILVRKKTEQRSNFILDINSYRQEKNRSILLLAREMAQQVLREKRAVVLRPMSPYERRIVHLELSQNLQIKTESVGEGENRKVVIKPAELA
jgi:spoIIIJ-associated protein